MIERLQEELHRKRVAGVNLSMLMLWFNPKTFAEIEADLDWRGLLTERPSTETIQRLGLSYSILGMPVKLSDRVKVGFVSVTMDDEVMAEWDLTEAA